MYKIEWLLDGVPQSTEVDSVWRVADMIENTRLSNRFARHEVREFKVTIIG